MSFWIDKPYRVVAFLCTLQQNIRERILFDSILIQGFPLVGRPARCVFLISFCLLTHWQGMNTFLVIVLQSLCSRLSLSASDLNFCDFSLLYDLGNASIGTQRFEVPSHFLHWRPLPYLFPWHWSGLQRASCHNWPESMSCIAYVYQNVLAKEICVTL